MRDGLHYKFWVYIFAAGLASSVLESPAAKSDSRDRLSVELPESVSQSTHPRDLSTPPQSLRSVVVGRDDSSLFIL
jgi:hypothetical protein